MRGAGRRRRPEHPLGALARRARGPSAGSRRRRRPACRRRASRAARGRRARRCARRASSCARVSGGSARPAARDVPDRLEQLVRAARPCRRSRRRPPRAQAPGPRRRRRPCRGSPRRSARSALSRRHTAMPSPSRELMVEQHDVRALAARAGRTRRRRPRAAPTGTMPGSERSSIPSPARTAGCGVDDRDARHASGRSQARVNSDLNAANVGRRAAARPRAHPASPSATTTGFLALDRGRPVDRRRRVLRPARPERRRQDHADPRGLQPDPGHGRRGARSSATRTRRSRRGGWSGSPSRTSTSTASSTSRRRCSTTAATTGWTARTRARARGR